MAAVQVIVFAVLMLCVLELKADFLPDLEYYYLNTMGTQSMEIIPQDGQDAQTILDSDKNPEVIAKILLNRDKIRRININKEINAKDGKHPLLSDKYRVQGRKNPIHDLYFILVNDENMVIGTYLRNFLVDYYDEISTNIAMVLTKDMGAMIRTYDETWSYKFKSSRKQQRRRFEHMLRVWVRQNRELNEKEELKPDIIQKEVDALETEYNDGGWHENRDQIELILMKKSIKFAREVIKGFEKKHVNCTMEQMINESIDKHGLDKSLAHTYSSLARYVKDRYQYMADILRQYSDGKDDWDVWMMCIAVTFPEEWVKIDNAFRKADNRDIPLSKFIMEKVTNHDHQMFASMVSQIVDATNKGTSKMLSKPQPAPAPSAQPSPAPAPPQPPSG